MPRKHPMQPLCLDSGVLRFKRNAIIDWLFDSGKLDLNEIALIPFPAEDRMQLAQLLGYSLGGYEELPYVTDESVEEVHGLAAELREAEGAG